MGNHVEKWLFYKSPMVRNILDIPIEYVCLLFHLFFKEASFFKGAVNIFILCKFLLNIAY